MAPQRGPANRVVDEIADLTGRSPDEVKVFIGGAVVLTCAVVALRTVNFFADLKAAMTPPPSRRTTHRLGPT